MSINPRRILYEDEHILAVEKLSGELVVQGKGRVEKLPLLDFLKRDEPGLRALHRIDFETSGVVVFAKTRAAHAAVLASKFRGWKKVYRTLVLGRMPQREGVIRVALPARANPKGASGTMIEALTRYRVLESFGDVSSVEVEIETGRHHQIRRHFAALSHPLILDEVYGQKGFNRKCTKVLGYRKFFLHASSLELPHPLTGKIVRIEAKLPRAFEEVLEKLRGK